MNFTERDDLIEKPIIDSVKDKNNGGSETYNKYISDTEEAKNLINTDFMQTEFKSYNDVTQWFVNNYKMYDSNPQNKQDKEHSLSFN